MIHFTSFGHTRWFQPNWSSNVCNSSDSQQFNFKMIVISAFVVDESGQLESARNLPMRVSLMIIFCVFNLVCNIMNVLASTGLYLQKGKKNTHKLILLFNIILCRTFGSKSKKLFKNSRNSITNAYKRIT